MAKAAAANGAKSTTSKAPSSGSRKEQKKASRSSKDGLARTMQYSFFGVAGFVLCLALWIAVKGIGGRKPSAVVSLTTEAAFDKFVNAHPEGALVEFYVPGCSHCQTLRPEFDAAALELRNAGGATPLADVDGNTQPALVKRFGITRYPTMLWFRKGENVLELGPLTRTKEKILDYVKWASQPALIEFQTAAELDDALPTLRQTLSSKLPPLIVGFKGRSGLRAALESVAERLRGKTVFIYVDEAASDEGSPVRAYAREPASDEQYSGRINLDDVLAWAKTLVKRSKKTANTSESASSTADAEGGSASSSAASA